MHLNHPCNSMHYIIQRIKDAGRLQTRRKICCFKQVAATSKVIGPGHQLQWNLVSVNSRGPSEKVHYKRNFTIMLGDIKVVHIKQVFRFNRVRYNEVPL